MKIEHVAMWTEDIDRLTQFYAQYFDARIGSLYQHAAKGFESRFVSFSGGARLEIMRTTRLSPIALAPGAERMGLTHLAIALGSERAVDEMFVRLRADGCDMLDGPRRTGDGYYECVVLDPDGNRVEITA